VIVGTTNGSLIMLDPSANFSQTVIASGGGYIDFFGVDQTNGSLFFGQPFELWRMSCGQGCGIGVTPPPDPTGNVPEPGTALIFALGSVVLARTRRRKN
jgi:PEP-CTERM motif